MDRRLRRSWFSLCIALLALFSTRFAAGAPNDAAAQKLRDQAIEQDFLATNYEAAEKKLNDALTLCQKTSDCSPAVRARIHCDLGVIELMLKKLDLARTEFATALMEDPNVGLDPNLSNTDAQREFAGVKGGGTGGGGSAAPAGPAGAGVPPGGAAPAAAGNSGLVHTPPPAQAVRTPLPLYAEVADDIGATKLVLRYKPVGSKTWKSLPMHPIQRGFGAEIPCGDVGDKEGQLEYYVQALDANGDLVAASGRSNAPHKVAIVKKVEGEPPHFPEQTPPHACAVGSTTEAPSSVPEAPITNAESSDCPPGFPGCHAEAQTCESNDDCGARETCEDHLCQAAEVEDNNYKKNWVSLSIQADLLYMPGANDACLGGQGYTCFNAGTSTHFDAIPIKGADDKVLGGFASAPMLRILLGYDRAVSRHFMLGMRAGYSFLGAGPQRPGGAGFLPLHLEARLAYWFGKNALSRKGLRAFASLSGGITETDASQTIDAFPTGTRTAVNVDAWTKTGLGFVALGPGVMYAINRRGGFTLEVKGELLFPTFGAAFAAALGYSYGF